MKQREAIEVCKVVALGILVNTAITEDESRFLDKLMDHFELDEAARKEVTARNFDDDVVAMVERVKSHFGKAALISELTQAIAVDGMVDAAERKLAEEIAELVDISHDDLESLIFHSLQGSPHGDGYPSDS